MKNSAPAHVESPHNTSRSNEDAPEAPLGVQTSNPTPTTLSELTARFSLAVEAVLFDLDSALAAKGRQKETNDLLKLQKTLKSYDEQTILDAVRYVIEKLDSVKSLGAYLRKALEGSYKPSQQQITQQTAKATPEEPKPAEGALDSFLSEGAWEKFREANLTGKYLEMCEGQLRRDWRMTEDQHRTIIGYWKQFQRDKVWG